MSNEPAAEVKGVIFVGDRIKAKFDADGSNSGAGTLQVGASGGSTRSCEAAPSGTCTTDEVEATEAGVARVLAGTEKGGLLTTFVNGEERDSEQIDASRQWDYTVVA
jgi:hypothetical protein